MPPLELRDSKVKITSIKVKLSYLKRVVGFRHVSSRRVIDITDPNLNVNPFLKIKHLILKMWSIGTLTKRKFN